MTVTAPRVTPMARARSAREIGCCARTRFSAILAVDVAGGALLGDTEPAGVDSAH